METQAESTLRRSETLYRSLAELSDDAIFVVDQQFRMIYLNQASARNLGGRPEELVNSSITDLFPPESVAVMIPRLRAVFASGQRHNNIENLILSGRSVWLDTSLVPLFDDSGTVTSVQGVARDITARKQAEDELYQITRDWEETFEAITDAITLHDKDYNIIRANSAAKKMLESGDLGSLLRKKCFRAYHGTTAPLEGCPSCECLVTGKPSTFEIFEPFLNRFLEIDAIPRIDREGQIVGVIHIVRDITKKKQAEEERKKQEQQIQQTQKLESLGVLAGGIAHDFNNILMAVLGHADLALEEMSPMSPARQDINQIIVASRSAAELCRQMLAYSGKASFALERVNIEELIDEMVHLLKTSISKKAILNLNTTKNLPPISADPSQIRQIIMNLIINASDAIGERSGTITLSLGATYFDNSYLLETELHNELEPGLYLHLEVSDTGGGMNAETRARIFEPFFTTKFTGRGLGLAAALGIIKTHRGAIKVYSEIGKGTTFKILFPALDEEKPQTHPTGLDAFADWHGQGRILLADDEESLRALGAKMLERLGFTVITAADGQIAVELYKKHASEIDLVILDLTMPRLDGAEALVQLRQINPLVHVIVSSGYSVSDISSRFAGMGLVGVLQKPYTLAKMRSLLADWMLKSQ